MEIEVSDKVSNEVQWDMLKPGDVVSCTNTLFLTFTTGGRIQFLNLHGFKAVTMDYVKALSGLPVLMDTTLKVSDVGTELVQVKDPWEWKQLYSTWLDHARWNSETKVFEITMQNGSKYNYKNVPEYHWDEFLIANSHGRYYNDHIKGQYERIE